jgi:hypothetical protein
MRDHKGEYKARNRKSLKAIREGRLTAEQAIERLGSEAAGDVAERVREVDTPPNTPETIRKKGSANPLIDSGHLRQSITHEVIK